jgi:hypothetical protein
MASLMRRELTDKLRDMECDAVISSALGKRHAVRQFVISMHSVFIAIEKLQDGERSIEPMSIIDFERCFAPWKATVNIWPSHTTVPL